MVMRWVSACDAIPRWASQQGRRLSGSLYNARYRGAGIAGWSGAEAGSTETAVFRGRLRPIARAFRMTTGAYTPVYTRPGMLICITNGKDSGTG
jgi:hypothetical protein